MHYDLNIVLLYGITFGIILMSIVYTFIRYVYSKDIFYISYCFMQVFSLLYIVAYSKFFNISFVIQELSLILASISAVIFAISFYEGKFFPKINNYKELIFSTIAFNIVVLTAFYHYVLFEYLPYTIIYGIIFISIIFNLKQSFKINAIYVFGWSLFCFLLFAFNFKAYYEEQGYMNIVLIAFAIEALLFTISVSYKYNNLKNQSKFFEDMLLQQSKLAKSGEMIANITHQFRQPLNNLSYILINLKKKYKNNNLDEIYFDKKYNQANSQLEFLSKTIDDFKEFYSLSKNKENFILKESIENSITVLSADFKKHNIEFSLDFYTNEDIKIFGIKNEFSQVILAILSNAKEVLINIEKPLIKMEILKKNKKVIVQIEDNAGGIKQKDLSKIFEPYFTTKEEGLGIGLYLSKLIIEKSFLGQIKVENKNKGALFTLILDEALL